jgi:hypothetical protein
MKNNAQQSRRDKPNQYSSNTFQGTVECFEKNPYLKCPVLEGMIVSARLRRASHV